LQRLWFIKAGAKDLGNGKSGTGRITGVIFKDWMHLIYFTVSSTIFNTFVAILLKI
jgi:hypothetical protein